MTSPRKLLSPEVIQIASIDCGPACLKSAFAGFGLDVGYDALRDACQTDVDGTMIDSLGQVANQLGLRAQQIWLPVDHLTIAGVSPLPAILVTQTRGGAPHFIVAWRQIGNLVQIMDPSAGRSWVTRERLASMIFPYQLGVAAAVWQKWARSAEFERAMTERLARIGATAQLLTWAKGHPHGSALSCLDAACRMVDTLLRSGALRKGKETRELIAALVAEAIGDASAGTPTRTIPESFFAALPLDGTNERVRLVGAILLRLRGRREGVASPTKAALGRDAVARAKDERKQRPWVETFRLVRKEGGLTLGLLAWTFLVASVVAFFEALLLRGLLDMDSRLNGVGQRAIALVAFVLFILVGTALDLWSTKAARAVGRRFELRLRALLLAKIPFLGDGYFRSRPAADFAHRFHVLHPVRNVPILAGRIARLAATLLATVAGLLWLDPRSFGLTLVAAVACVAIPWVGQSLIAERDLKVRVHDARLAQFNLDALLGLLPIRAHGAEPTIRGEHASVVLEWVNACRERLRVSVGVDVLQSVVSALLSLALVGSYVLRSANPGALLLLTYWALSLPAIGEEMAALTRQLPHFGNLLTRVLEPIHAPAFAERAEDAASPTDVPPYRTSATELDAAAAHGSPRRSQTRPVEIVLDNVSIQVSGRAIMSNVDLRLRAGEHVAIVGPSGAGKSTLLALLLGFHEATSGAVWVDRSPLVGSSLRDRTAWVDPAVSLWNRSLLENVRYGSETRELDMTSIIEQADLLDVLRRLPQGLESELGEGGRVVSGGEGQRVRLARAMTRPHADLVLLDEPFRGLERELRERLLRRARALWKQSTLLCVTHDVSQACSFDRVIVIDGGAIVEQGPPDVLAAAGGRFQRLLEAEKRVHAERWNDPSWRKLRVASGLATEIS